ncbi:MAG: His-Xaa-Ser system protein HxsD [Deltaproteobacteria bacterium]|nr:His-Xaa-Ser system protein HxsD [Deltaproteobacteria bacterium]
MDSTIEAGKNRVRIDIDERVYGRDAVLASAYRFIDRCYVRLARAGRRRLQVELKGKLKLARAGLAELADEFANELLHQMVRHEVAHRTAALREVIVGRALLSAEPVEPADALAGSAEEDDLDYLDDPLGIAVPWEEKYGDDEGGSKD